MEYNLLFTLRAKSRLIVLLDYLTVNWGIRVKNKFISELEHCLEIIQINPYSFPCYNTSELRKCIITPLNILYYTIQGNDILIISIEDTRMNYTVMEE